MANPNARCPHCGHEWHCKNEIQNSLVRKELLIKEEWGEWEDIDPKGYIELSHNTEECQKSFKILLDNVV